jgi:hypothetical protein
MAGTFAANCSSFPTAVCLWSLERCVYRMVMLMSRCPSNSFTSGQIHPGHHQATRERMPEIVKGEVLDLRLLYRPLKGGTEGAIRHPITVTEHPIALIICEINRFQEVRQ